MVKIKFIRDSRPGESDVEFQAGKVIEVDGASAFRWERRGAAEVVVDTPKRKAGAKGDEADDQVGE